jgi:hypothetical protein
MAINREKLQQTRNDIIQRQQEAGLVPKDGVGKPPNNLGVLEDVFLRPQAGGAQDLTRVDARRPTRVIVDGVQFMFPRKTP